MIQLTAFRGVPSTPVADRDGELPPECAAKYRITRLLGSGGFGHVYEAHQITLNRRVVVKVPNADALADAASIARFVKEARITAMLAHPNIVVLLDFGAAEGRPWIVYELVEGHDLRAALAHGPLAIPDAARAVVQVCEGLELAHSRGILHRDLKPENVLRTKDGLCKVADFGLAKWGGSGTVLTQAGMLLGTPAYLAPEQVMGEPATRKSDLYATGVMLYELLTGKTPFEGNSPLEVLQKHLRESPDRPSDRRRELPAKLDDLILRLLAKSPDDRPGSAGAVREELTAWAEAEPGNRTRTLITRPAAGMAFTGIQRANPRRDWNRIAFGAIVLLCLLAPVGAWLHSTLSPGPSEPRSSPPVKAVRAPLPPAAPPPQRPAATVDSLRQHVQTHPGDLASWLKLAEAMEPNNWNGASVKYDYVLSNARPGDSELLSRAHLGLGRCLIRQGQDSKAEAEFRASMALSPGSDEAVNQLGRLVMSRPDSANQVIALLRSSLSRRRGNAEGHRILAHLYQARNSWEEAVPHLREAIALDPADFQSRKTLGVHLTHRQKIAEALPILESGRALSPGDAEVLASIGDCHGLSSRWKEAKEAYGQALKIDPDSQALAGLGHVLANSGELAEAEVTLRSRVMKVPTDTSCHLALGFAMEKLKRFDEARRQFEEGLQHVPKDPWLNVAVAERLMTTDPEKAARHCEAALEGDPKHLLSLSYLADIRQRQGKLEKALQLSRRILELDPRSQGRRRLLVDILARSKRFDEAIAELRKSLEYFPDDSWAKQELAGQLAGQLARSGRDAEAIVEYRKSIALQPDQPDIRRQLCDSLRRTGARTEASRLIEEQLIRYPKDAAAHRAKGELLELAGRLREAEASVRRALELEPGSTPSLVAMGQLIHRQGLHAQGRAYIQQAIDTDPKADWARLVMGQAHREERQNALCEKSFREAVSLNPDNALAHSCLSEILEEQGKLDEALLQARRALFLEPGNAAYQAQVARLGKVETTGPPVIPQVEEQRPAGR